MRTLFGYPNLGAVLSPFLLLHYAEPIVGEGPFVMNTAQEIRQAIVDYQNGRMGHLR